MRESFRDLVRRLREDLVREDRPAPCDPAPESPWILLPEIRSGGTSPAQPGPFIFLPDFHNRTGAHKVIPLPQTNDSREHPNPLSQETQRPRGEQGLAAETKDRPASSALIEEPRFTSAPQATAVERDTANVAGDAALGQPAGPARPADDPAETVPREQLDEDPFVLDEERAEFSSPAQEAASSFVSPGEFDSGSESEGRSDSPEEAPPPSRSIENLIESLDRQLTAAAQDQTRTLDRLADLLRRALASQTDLASVTDRLDQLEAAHHLRGRL